MVKKSGTAHQQSVLFIQMLVGWVTGALQWSMDVT